MVLGFGTAGACAGLLAKKGTRPMKKCYPKAPGIRRNAMRKLTLLSGIAAAAILLPSAGFAQTVPHVPNVVTSHVPDTHTATTDVHNATDVHVVTPTGHDTGTHD